MAIFPPRPPRRSVFPRLVCHLNCISPLFSLTTAVTPPGPPVTRAAPARASVSEGVDAESLGGGSLAGLVISPRETATWEVVKEGYLVKTAGSVVKSSKLRWFVAKQGPLVDGVRRGR